MAMPTFVGLFFPLTSNLHLISDTSIICSRKPLEQSACHFLCAMASLDHYFSFKTSSQLNSSNGTSAQGEVNTA